MRENELDIRLKKLEIFKTCFFFLPTLDLIFFLIKQPRFENNLKQINLAVSNCI